MTPDEEQAAIEAQEQEDMGRQLERVARIAKHLREELLESKVLMYPDVILAMKKKAEPHILALHELYKTLEALFPTPRG